MRSPIFSGPPKRLRYLILVRRISGDSMLPALRAGWIVIAVPQLRRYRIGDVVVLKHNGVDKIKRITGVRTVQNVREIYIRGDNASASTDSRHFGWLPDTVVLGKVIWPRYRKLDYRNFEISS